MSLNLAASYKGHIDSLRLLLKTLESAKLPTEIILTALKTALENTKETDAWDQELLSLLTPKRTPKPPKAEHILSFRNKDPKLMSDEEKQWWAAERICLDKKAFYDHKNENNALGEKIRTLWPILLKEGHVIDETPGRQVSTAPSVEQLLTKKDIPKPEDLILF